MTAALLRAIAALGEAVGVVETLAPQMLRAERIRLEDSADAWRRALGDVVAEQGGLVLATPYAPPPLDVGDGLHEITVSAT